MRALLLAFVAVALLLPFRSGWTAAPERYLNPIDLALSADGRLLYVVCEGSDEVLEVDTGARSVVRRIPVGHVPKGIAFSPDARRMYVTNSWSDTVSEVDLASATLARTLKSGFEPHSVALDKSGKFLYTANRITSDISVIDLNSGKEANRLVAGRGASYLALSPDGGRLFATHIYPNIGSFRTEPESEITEIDTGSQVVERRHRLHNVAGVFHVAVSADGRLGAACLLRPKNLIPLAHVEHGWAFTDSIALFGEDVPGVIQLPLDELDRYLSLPFGLAIAPDKSRIYLSAAGSDVVAVLDAAKLLESARSPNRASLSTDLSASAAYVLARIPVGRNPRAVALPAGGRLLYVANRLDDTISVIDTESLKVTGTIELGGPKTITPERRGQRLFFASRFSFQGAFGCANCHLDATIDGLSWDLEPDGFGIDIVDNRSLEEVGETAPFKWNGGNPDLETECGPRTEKFFFRSQSFDREELADLVRYIKAIPLRPNRYRLPNGELTPVQERGRVIFERTHRKDSAAIPESLQCPVCHSGKYYTNRELTDVGSKKWNDRSPMLDVPHLSNIALSAPYLHDGSARAMEEIWTVFNPKDTHGVTNDLTKDELNDLIEYLKTL